MAIVGRLGGLVVLLQRKTEQDLPKARTSNQSRGKKIFGDSKRRKRIVP
jgi:hypothetical protein